MAKAFGIVISAGSNIKVKGLHDYRPIGAFSFLGRYRVIDFPISNMSNSGIERVQVYTGNNPRSIVEHLGSGRHYNINSKRGNLQMLFNEGSKVNEIYNTNIEAFSENLSFIERQHADYVVIAPSYMVYRQDFAKMLDAHVDSGADVTLLYHRVDTARTAFLNCDVLNLNRQKGVQAIEHNLGNVKDRNIFMDTYVMKKDLLLKLIADAKALSSAYTLTQIINEELGDLDVRGIQHKGYFNAIMDFKDYINANMALLDPAQAADLFLEEGWPIYTRTTDSCPTKYLETATVRNSMISNGCIIEGTVENSIIGRGCRIEKGAVVKNCIVTAYSVIGEDVHIENQVVDKWAQIRHTKEIIADAENPGYIKRSDRL